MIAQSVRGKAAEFRREFDEGSPFRHVAIDGFLDRGAIDRLIAEFPAFDPACAINEFGEVGGKDVHERLSDVSPAYRDLAEFAASPELPGFLSEITGIDDLIWGGENTYGGGTHENLNGQGLAAHIDFNRDERNGLHRRLNVLLYLNEEWAPDWGGALELHADPRKPETNWHVAYEPLANRAVIHETTEWSWHGFRPIKLPPEKPHLSRRSVALYFYTRERPAAETAGSHTTHYILPPLPDFLVPGRRLDAGQIAAVKEHTRLCGGFVTMHQRLEVASAARAEALEVALAGLRETGLPPRMGFAELVPGSLSGIWDDRWVGPRFAARYRTLLPLAGLRLRLFVPEAARGDYHFRVTCAGRTETFTFDDMAGAHSISIEALDLATESEFDLLLETLDRPAAPADRADLRDLAVVLDRIDLDHGAGGRLPGGEGGRLSDTDLPAN